MRSKVSIFWDALQKSKIGDYLLLGIQGDYLLLGMKGQGQGYVIIPKKAKEKEEERRKGKGKKEEWEDVRQFQKMEENSQENNPRSVGKDIPKEEKKKRHDELCGILLHHSSSEILKCLKKHRYDMTETINHMTDQAQKIESNKKKKLDKTEMAHYLISQVCDQFEKENITGEQFQQIFDEIAEMFREKDPEGQENNSFEDQCSSLKAALQLAFQKELVNYDGFQFDLQSRLWQQTEEFKLQANKHRCKAPKDIDKDFPLLQSNVKEEESIYFKHQKQQKEKQKQLVLFLPPKPYIPIFAQKKGNTHSIFNLDNEDQTKTALTTLTTLLKNFRNIPILWLKFVFWQLDGDYNHCSEFFWKYYKEMCEKQIIPVRRALPSQPQQPQRPRVMSNVQSKAKKEEVDEDVSDLSLGEIRDELDYLYKLRQTIQVMKGKVKSGNQSQQLQRMISQKNPRIAKLSRAARIRQLQRMQQGNPLYIDLHGYRQQQIPPLFDDIARMLQEKAKKIGNTATFIAMTGKGSHSWGHRSVLKPAIQAWCNRNNYHNTEQTDHIRISFPLK